MPRDRDLVLPEQPPPVERGRHHEVADDHESDRRGDADPRARDRDREDDVEAHQPAHPEPHRLVERGPDAGEAALPDDQDRDGESIDTSVANASAGTTPTRSP